MPTSRKKDPKRSAFNAPSTSTPQTQSSVIHDLMNRAQAAQEETTDGRGKAGHGSGVTGKHKTGREQKSYDVPVEVQEMVKAAAKQLDVSQGNIVTLGAILVHNLLETGDLDVDPFIEFHGKSLHNRYKLDVPLDFTLKIKK